jgi:Trypsin-co-occurring domain 1
VPYLLGLPTATGSDDVLVFEVDRSEADGGLVLASPDPDRTVDRARVTLDEALAKVKPSLHKLAEMLADLSPAETEVEFGLKIGGETGVIIAKGTAEVNFRVRLRWGATPSERNDSDETV